MCLHINCTEIKQTRFLVIEEQFVIMDVNKTQSTS